MSERKPWSASVCNAIIAKYPDDVELWSKAVEAIQKLREEGADDQHLVDCLLNLEAEWEKDLTRGPKNDG